MRDTLEQQLAARLRSVGETIDDELAVPADLELQVKRRRRRVRSSRLWSGLVGPLLRSAEQGADTIVWLAAAPEAAAHSGSFWHDRRRRRVHRVPWTRSDDERAEARRLFSWCAAQAGVPEADVP